MTDLPPTAELAPAIRSGGLFVAHCSKDEIWIVCRSSAPSGRWLKGHGYAFRPAETSGESRPASDGHYFVVSAPDNAARGRELMRLRDWGIPFSIGKEWNPCEVFEHLRELGLANGGYWSIGHFWPQGLDVRWND